MSPARVALALGVALLPAAKPRLDWHHAIGKALADAQERRQPVLIYFRNGNCGLGARPGQSETPMVPTADGVGGRSLMGETLNDCDRLDDDVWSKKEVEADAGRFALLLAADDLDALRRRYLVSTLPTVLFADSWGNEIIRIAGYTPLDKFLRIMKAIPGDLSPLERWGALLSREGENAGALVGAAQFYQGVGLGIVSERYYERALGLGVLDADTARRREIVIARGVNLLGLLRAGEAAKLFEGELAKAPDGPASDLILLGAVMAELQDGKRDQARRSYETMRAKYPGSAATARAGEHMKAAEAPKP